MFLLPDSYLAIKQSNPEYPQSKGVFAKKDIEGGTVIGDYLGKIISEENIDEKKYGTYYMSYNSSVSSIYADPKLPGIHIINHSCMPNCCMYDYKNHTLYFALRKIFKGEELTVTYNLGFPDENCNPCTHACYCGTPLCNGSMHSADYETTSTKEEEKKDDFLPPGSELPQLPKYPKIIRDSIEDNIYASLKMKPLDYNADTLFTETQIHREIRKTGRGLHFTKLHTTIVGIQNHYLLSKYSK